MFFFSEENRKSELSRTVPKIIIQLTSSNKAFTLDAEEQIYTVCERKRAHLVYFNVPTMTVHGQLQIYFAQ